MFGVSRRGVTVLGARAGAVGLLRHTGDVSGRLKDVLASRKPLPADGYDGVGHDDGKVSQRPAIYVILTATRVAAAGFEDISSSLEGAQVIAPAFRSVHTRLDGPDAGSLPERLAARAMLREAELLWEHGVLEYLFLVARKP